jgi:hypothetical protein
MEAVDYHPNIDTLFSLGWILMNGIGISPKIRFDPSTHFFKFQMKFLGRNFCKAENLRRSYADWHTSRATRRRCTSYQGCVYGVLDRGANDITLARLADTYS